MLVIGFLSILYALVSGIRSKRKMKIKKERLKEMRKIANNDLMEKIFFDAMTKKMLVLISLSSRKVYVGMPVSPRIEHGDFENVEVIPTAQIEYVSLFDPTTFDKFQSVLDDSSKELDEAA